MQANRFPQPALRPQAHAQVARPLRQLRARPSLRAARSQDHQHSQLPLLAEAIRQLRRRTIPLPRYCKHCAASGGRMLIYGIGFLRPGRSSHLFDERRCIGPGRSPILRQRTGSCDRRSPFGWDRPSRPETRECPHRYLRPSRRYRLWLRKAHPARILPVDRHLLLRHKGIPCPRDGPRMGSRLFGRHMGVRDTPLPLSVCPGESET